MNKYEKALQRIRKNIEISEKWSEEDINHYKTIVEALEIASKKDFATDTKDGSKTEKGGAE